MCYEGSCVVPFDTQVCHSPLHASAMDAPAFNLCVRVSKPCVLRVCRVCVACVVACTCWACDLSV
jgi:hypothetical protein